MVESIRREWFGSFSFFFFLFFLFCFAGYVSVIRVSFVWPIRDPGLRFSWGSCGGGFVPTWGCADYFDFIVWTILIGKFEMLFMSSD